MSSSMVPEYNERNPFVRLADAWYGQTTGAADSGGYARFGRDLFLPDASMSDMASRSYWNADIPSDLMFLPWIDDTKPVGYIRFNTGRPTMDAIATVVANSVGIDNLLRAKSGVTRGDWSAYFKEVPLGIAEALSAGVGGMVVRRGLGTTFGKVAARGTGLPTLTSPVLGIPLQGPTAPRIVRGFQNVPAAVSSWASNVAQNTASRWNPAAPISSVARQTAAGVRGALRNVRAYPGRYGVAALIAGGVAGALTGTPRATATELAETRANATATPDGLPRLPRDIVPTGDPITDAGNNARGDVAGINRQYNNILRELQNMYQLSETEEERERLRFMLADIEAQRDAGLQAISEGYAQTVAAIQQRGEISRQQTAERAKRFGSQLEGYADRTAQRMMLQNLEQQQQFRGLGSGSQTPVNEWVGLMSAMAPLQQQYTQRIGDITGEGIDWLAGTVGAQGQAQQADLQRLAAATRSASIMSHQRQIADRIQRDTEQQRAAILQAMMAQAGSVGATGVDAETRFRFMEERPSLRPGQMTQALRELGWADMTPGELALLESRNRAFYGDEAIDAANQPAS